LNPFDVLAEEAIQEHKDSKTQKLLVGTIQNIDGNFVIVRLSDDVVLTFPKELLGDDVLIDDIVYLITDHFVQNVFGMQED